MVMGFLLLFYRAGEHHWSAVLALAAVGLSSRSRRLGPHEIALPGVCLLMLAAPTTFPAMAPDARDWSVAGTLLLPATRVLPGFLLFWLLLRSVRADARPLS
jgi:hypothetical protein